MAAIAPRRSFADRLAWADMTLALVVAVLGSIIGGVAAPTEAASMGALGAILVVAAARRLTLQVLRSNAGTFVSTKV